MLAGRSSVKFGLHFSMHDLKSMPLDSAFLHCMWLNRKSRLSRTRACEIFSFSQGGTLLRPVLVPCGLVDQKVLYCFQHRVFVVPLLLLAAGVGFLLLGFDEENVLLLKYNQSRITQGRDKPVEDKQDQSMKGCSHKELGKDNYQQWTTAINIHCTSG